MYAHNQWSPQQTPWYVDVLWRYLDWVSLVILAAAIISAAVPNDGSRGWTSFVLLIIELNLIVWVGYFTDRNAGNAIKELEVCWLGGGGVLSTIDACCHISSLLIHHQALSAPHCICKRDGEWKELEVRELCLGDVIQLKGGDVIPADSRVWFCHWSCECMYQACECMYSNMTTFAMVCRCDCTSCTTSCWHHFPRPHHIPHTVDWQG